MNKPKILADNITHLTDARYFAASMVDWMVFPIDPALPESRQLFHAIRGWVEGPKFAVSISEKLLEKEVLEMIDSLNLDGIKLTQSVDYQLPTNIFHFAEIIIGLENGSPKKQWSMDGSPADAHILNLQHSSNPLKMINNITRRMQDENISIWLDLPLERQIWESIEWEFIDGLCVHGGVESGTGMKNYEAIDAVFEWMEDNF